MYRRIFSAVVAILSLVATPVRADDAADCKSELPDVAISGCTKILKRKISAQDKATAHSYLARAYMWKGQPDQAFSHAMSAISADPKNANAYFVRANVYRDRGDIERAMEDLSKAIQLNPKHTWAYHERAALFRQKREFDRAIVEMNHAIELEPKNPSFYVDRGGALRKQGTARSKLRRLQQGGRH